MQIRITTENSPKEVLDFKVTYKGRPVVCSAVEVEFDIETKQYIFLDGGKTNE